MKVNSLQEYKDFVERHNIPLDTIRFALGEDKGHDPRWFYIYQDRFTGEWVVAKNKSDGSTAERYRGNDEAKACQILFDKMEEEFNKRKYAGEDTAGGASGSAGNSQKRKKSHFFFVRAEISAVFNRYTYMCVCILGWIQGYAYKETGAGLLCLS